VTRTTEAVPDVGRYRLLGHPGDLAGHVAALGPVPLPTGRAHAWREHFVAALESSGLGGRGGANFSAAVKLAVASSAGRGGTIVVNGMEGEPASDKDKLLLLRHPHLVLDGAQLLATAMEAARVTVCVPAGRDHVAAAVSTAMSERMATGCSPVPETLLRPPDRFVAGEESALVAYVRSGASLPTFRPDKGVPLRLGRRGTLVHNAETLAHVAMIARTGPQAFRARGVAEDPGTSLVTISGAVQQPGVVEIERGTPLVEVAARATPTGPAQAFLVGGYGGSWVGPADFSTPYASLSLRTIGATAGVGILVVLGADACGIAESARIASYLAEQSAGQCGPCVNGLPAIADDMTRLARGEVDAHLIERLGRRLAEVNGRGACRHPDGAVSLVRSALTVFADDVRSHLRGAPCPHRNRPTALRFPRLAEVA
jgi:NADH:ubiquinone oxidoreductase subunit F (NADH-binding)